MRDAAKSTAWYEQVLGMSRWYDSEFIFSGIGSPSAKAGDKTQLVSLKAEDPVIGILGLLQWTDPPMAAPGQIPIKVAFGAPIFVVDSDDARGVCEPARGLGRHVHAEPHERSTKDADTKMKNFVSTSVF